MNRSHFNTESNPLGVAGSEFDGDRPSSGSAAASRPTKLDRWLLGLLAERFDTSRVRLALWDTPSDTGPGALPVTVRFGDRGALYHLLTNPAANFGDLYSAGRITVHGDLLVVLDEAFRSRIAQRKLSRPLARVRAKTPNLADSRRNIHHHYDIGNEFYRLWLDRDALQYTCAYYADEAMSLEQAQQAKMHHVCRKLRLEPGERVVEAGCGWGGFAIFMARNYGVRVRSFNISREQIAWARDWAKAEGQDGLIEFVEDDYRNMSGRYDVFVSVGMLEHVGPGNYRQLGALAGRVLTPEGRGLMHSIGRDRLVPLNPWIERRIFPGAYPPTLSRNDGDFRAQWIFGAGRREPPPALRAHAGALARTLRGQRRHGALDVRRSLRACVAALPRRIDQGVRAWHAAAFPGAFQPLRHKRDPLDPGSPVPAR